MHGMGDLSFDSVSYSDVKIVVNFTELSVIICVICVLEIYGEVH